MTITSSPIATCLELTTAISKSRTVEEIYEAALDALRAGLGVERASILLFDADGVMRFKAYRGLSDAYRRAVEGHTPWRPDSPYPQPIWVSDVAADRACAAYAAVFAAEGIAALAFIPLISQDRVIGKFMLYYGVLTPPSTEVLQLAGVIATQVAFAVARTRTEQEVRRSALGDCQSSLDALWVVGPKLLHQTERLIEGERPRHVSDVDGDEAKALCRGGCRRLSPSCSPTQG